MPRTQPGQGTYRLKPASKWNHPTYVVEIDGSGNLRRLPSTQPYPWSSSDQHFAFTGPVSGHLFAFVCFGGTYQHWSVPSSGAPILLDDGECEQIDGG